MTDLKRRYLGLLDTKPLWENNNVYNFKQFDFSKREVLLDLIIDNKLRLGKYIEQLLFYHFKKQGFNLVFENIQIKKNRITLGELDCILFSKENLLHIEFVYKFYLYDDSVGSSEIGHFIGPNRKDCLKDKLDKLKFKQLPLLYSEECKKEISLKKIDVKDVKQQVCFLGQLFIPYKKDVRLKFLNPLSINGYYINFGDLQCFENYKFYIPTKKDWIIIPHKQVEWMNFSFFKKEVSILLARKFSPLCWFKKQNGEIFKMFIVWW